MPLDDRGAQCLGNLECERGLAGAGLALDEKGSRQRDRCIHGHFEVFGGDVAAGAVEFHGGVLRLLGGFCELGVVVRSGQGHGSGARCRKVGTRLRVIGGESRTPLKEQPLVHINPALFSCDPIAT